MCSQCHTDSIKWSYYMCGIIQSAARKHNVNASDILWVTVVRHQRLTLRVKHGCVLEERILVDRHGTALGRGLHAGPWNREGFYERKIRSDCVCSYKRHEHKTAQGLLGLFYAFYYTGQGGLTVGMGEIGEHYSQDSNLWPFMSWAHERSLRHSYEHHNRFTNEKNICMDVWM